MSSIGERIKVLRKRVGITQEELGDLLGIKPAAISKFETDRVVPSEAQIKLICATYHVNYQWMTDGKEPMILRMDADSLVDKYVPEANAFFRACVRGAIELSDEDWIKFRDYVDSMRERIRNGDVE